LLIGVDGASAAGPAGLRRGLVGDRRRPWTGERSAEHRFERGAGDAQQSADPDHRKAHSAIGRPPLVGQGVRGGAADPQDQGRFFDGQEVRDDSAVTYTVP
jgi:hypothetical protein